VSNMLNRLRAKVARDGVGATLSAVLRYPFRRRPVASSAKKTRPAKAPKLSVHQRFEQIYANNAWRSDESRSGPGSEIGRTENLRTWLVRAVPAHGVTSIIDAPCGDFNWMKLVTPQIDATYLGLDIVEPLIASNAQTYGSDRVAFRVADIRHEPLPACDLIILRDFLFHLSYSDIDKVLRNLAKTNYRFLLTTTHTELGEFSNQNITTGGWRLIDLFSSPFGFSREAVVDAVEDYPPGFAIPRQMILVEKKDVPQWISER
jgi:hypothetical protein